MENDKKIFDEISHWIPEEHLERYWRFLARVEDLPEEDSVMRCILAMGAFTVVIRQAPGEVAKQLSECERTINQLLAAAQRSNGQLAASLQTQAATLQALSKKVVSQAHLDQVTRDIVQTLERRLDLYLKPLAADKAKVFGQKTQDLEKWLDYLSQKVQRTMADLGELTPKLTQELAYLQQMRSALQRSVQTNITEQVSGQQRWPWSWIASTMVICLAIIVAAGLLGARIEHLAEHQTGPLSQTAEEATGK